MNMVQVSCEDLPFLVGRAVLKRRAQGRSLAAERSLLEFSRKQINSNSMKRKMANGWLLGDDFEIELSNCKINGQM